MAINPDERIKLMVSITKCGTGNKMAGFYVRHKPYYNSVSLGGAANSEVLDYIGLETNEKDIVLTLIPAGKVPYINVDFRSYRAKILHNLSKINTIAKQ